MIIYKDLNDKIHQLESAEFEYLLPAGCVEITQAEADSLLAPTPDEQRGIDRNALKSTRDSALADLTHDFGDGRVMQVRPSDAGNIQIAVGTGLDREWVMADNTVATVTTAELQTAFDAGVQGAMVIWLDYTTSLKLL